MINYLVTGGAGFIGSNYILYMLEKYKQEINIINVDNFTHARNLEIKEELKRMTIISL